jgi:hypothetical protein
VIAKTTILIFTTTATIASGAWLGIAPAISNSPKFEQQVIQVGKGPGFIATADVNHDGKLDLLVADTEDGSISVLLGDGKRHFTPGPGSPLPCNPNPNDIVVTDMNGDGNPDLVIANHQTPYITVLLGDGTGRFKPSPHSPFATQSHPHPHGVAVADFMGNGKPAVVTDSWGRDQVLMMPSDGKGNLILPGKLFLTDGHSDQGVRSADFNKDGRPDIVTTGQDINAVSLLLNDGTGGFRKASGSPFAAGSAPWAFTIDDINRDGNPDVAVIPYHRDLHDLKQLGITVLLGNGKGGFTTMRGSPLSLAGCYGPDRVDTGDLTASGRRDIVVSCALNNKVFFFLAGMDGSFSNSSRSVPTGWGGIAVSDLDGDGKSDVVISNNDSGRITILFSQ